MSEQDMYYPQPVQQPRRPARAATPAQGTNLAAVVSRIEEAIELETTSIRTDVNFDIKASNARKSRYLYELNKAVKDVRIETLQANRDGIVRLRQKLVENEAALAAHLAAVTEVAGLLQEAIERSEGDGTYSSTNFRRSHAV